MRSDRPHTALALVLAATLAGGLAVPALAQDSAPDSAGDGAQQLAVEGLGKLLDALRAFIKSVPQYAAPEVLPNGDIIIRRIHPDQAPEKTPPKPKGGDDATST
jgi:hypothetical protein